MLMRQRTVYTPEGAVAHQHDVRSLVTLKAL